MSAALQLRSSEVLIASGKQTPKIYIPTLQLEKIQDLDFKGKKRKTAVILTGYGIPMLPHTRYPAIVKNAAL